MPGPTPDDQLSPFLADPPGSAILTDFDGTLSPIVTDPAAAVALPGADDVLAALAARFGTVGVVSGRPVSYLVSRLPAAAGVVHLRGLYGIERYQDGVISEVDEAIPWRAALAELAAAADTEAPPGAVVERKGLAVTLHVRNAPGAEAWLADFVARTAGPAGLIAHPGRQSVEIRPPIALDKGNVVDELGAGRGAVCFLGDDRGDLPAFAALRRLARQGVATLAVAVDSDEAPEALLERADVVVDGPPGALALLQRLLPTG